MKPLLLIGLMAVLLSGCISIEYSQKLDRDGSSLISQKMNFSGLLALGNDSGASVSDLSGVCENVTQGGSGLNCTYGDGVVTLNRSARADEGLYLFNKTSEFPYVIYTLELRKAPQLVESEVSSQGAAGAGMPADADFKDPSSKLAATTLRTAGAKMTYTVEMPGELMSAENGEIILNPDGRKLARYDLLELMSAGNYAIVKSRELDMLMIGAAAGAAVLLIGALAVAAVLLKAMKR